MLRSDPQSAPWTPPRARSQGAAVAGVGYSLPPRVVANAEIEDRLGLPAGWIKRRTGIDTRRVANDSETLVSYAAAAARMALEAGEVDPSAVDLVIVATTSNDVLLPNAAPMVAEAIGAHNAGGFDVGAACTGFLTALGAGAAWIEAGRASRVLVIGAEFMTRLTDPLDRATSVVFGDGAGAILLSATSSENGRIGPVILRTDGDTEGTIVAPHAANVHIRMDGHETFKRAVASLSGATLEAVAAAGSHLSDIELFVYHQANSRILTAVGETLGLDSDRVVDCIGDMGNTSAATLPLALAHAQASGRLKDGATVLLGAFGAGFTWGAAVLRWGC